MKSQGSKREIKADENGLMLTCSNRGNCLPKLELLRRSRGIGAHFKRQEKKAGSTKILLHALFKRGQPSLGPQAL